LLILLSKEQLGGFECSFHQDRSLNLEAISKIRR
jgi:hypothetical protein